MLISDLKAQISKYKALEEQWQERPNLLTTNNHSGNQQPHSWIREML